MKKISSLLKALLIAPAIISSCNQPKPTGPGAPGDPTLPKSYQIIELQTQKAVVNSDFPATIEGEQTVEIRPRVDGIIQQIYVQEGAQVKKGQTLFRINADQFQQQVRAATASVKIAQANVNAAQMQVNKVRPLVEKDIISKFELQNAQYAFESAQASLAQAQAQLSTAKTNLSYTYVTSPSNGVIGRTPYKTGALVSSNIPGPLTTVANVSRVYAYFSMNEKQLLDFTRYTKGGSLQAKVAQLPAVDLLLPDGSVYPEKGKIQTASGLINTATGASALKATFSNAMGLLRSGGTGTVRIPVTLDEALLVPQKATYEIQGKRFVYLVDADSVRSVSIGISPSSSGQTFIVTDGLKPGNKIVIEGIAALREGTKIKPVSVNADSVFKSLNPETKN